MVTTVQAFRSDDGKIFDTHLAAAKHDAFQKLMALKVFNSASADMVIERAAEVYAALLPLVLNTDEE
jgi:hypothetical protein